MQVQKLQQQFQFLEELATNPELINKVKGNNTDPLKDMWQIININKRLDASEQGINKVYIQNIFYKVYTLKKHIFLFLFISSYFVLIFF